ncbi:hypothetical protein HanHA300_Chr08g0297011 [Helianthus annuus]|nr:hypothetical protein HanHA300_Chr08g0297011 [Helianthus annuus]KAJ0555068.1 hypothetical protein HanHA89_Chr08g0315501 [Helianthus annuus]
MSNLYLSPHLKPSAFKNVRFIKNTSLSLSPHLKLTTTTQPSSSFTTSAFIHPPFLHYPPNQPPKTPPLKNHFLKFRPIASTTIFFTLHQSLLQLKNPVPSFIHRFFTTHQINHHFFTTHQINHLLPYYPVPSSIADHPLFYPLFPATTTSQTPPVLSPISVGHPLFSRFFQ